MPQRDPRDAPKYSFGGVGISCTNMQDAVDALFRTDLDLKRSAGEPRILLERLVVELCGLRRAGAR